MWERTRELEKLQREAKITIRGTEQLLHNKLLTKLGLIKLVKQRSSIESPIKAYKVSGAKKVSLHTLPVLIFLARHPQLVMVSDNTGLHLPWADHT